MKKLIFVLCAVLLAVVLFGCEEKEEEHPSGYKVHHYERDPDEIDVLICANAVTNEWYEYISYEQYKEIEQLFAKDQWLKAENVVYNEQDAAVSISIFYPNEATETEDSEIRDEEIYIYNDDIIIGYHYTSAHQMPLGTCEKINAYLQQYYQKQHDTVADLETFFPDFFTGEYETVWNHDYVKVLYERYDGAPISFDQMFCPGSPEMSAELLDVLKDCGQWEEIPFDMYLYLSVEPIIPIHFQCENLYGDDYYIDFRAMDNGQTHVAVNTYAAFLAPPEIYNEVEEILNHYEAQWEVIPLEE